MHKRSDTNLAAVLLLLDLLLTEAALYLAQVARFGLPYGETLAASAISLPLSIYAIVGVIWAGALLALVYQPRRTYRLGDEMYALTLAVGVATLLMAGALYLSFRDVSRLLFIYFGLIDVFLLIGAHASARLMVRSLLGARHERVRALIVGAGPVGIEVGASLLRQASAEFVLVGYVDDGVENQGSELNGAPVLGALEETATLITRHQVEEVIFALPPREHDKVAQLALDLQQLPVHVWIVPDYFDLALARTRLADLGGIPMVGLREPAIDGLQHIAKRVFDLVLSLVGFVLAAPLLLLIAILIKLDSPGPVIFKQQRVGENCRLFWMYKFRTMVADADKRLAEVVKRTGDGVVVHKVKGDPRVTRIGFWLRRTSLDELPQLFNVLKGEMSLVGPRPEMPWLVEQYKAWQRKRFSVPPGITGWWQVNGRSDRPMHLHTEDDLYYIQNYSFFLDVHILLKTIGTVVRGKGAY
ncbi:MAG: sugar transferase [Anaerolineae bacterium]|nr:sugar transferase [Anaerolineae bacterium]